MTTTADPYGLDTPPKLGDTKTAAAQAASDARLGREIDATNRAIGAARTATGADVERRPSLRAELSDRALDEWGPVAKKITRGDQRARGALTVPESADPTARIVAAMRAAGEAGEPVDPDGQHVAALTKYHRARTDADALAAARNEVTRQTTRALTDAVRDMRRDLVNAIAADLRDLASLAETVVESLDGATTADEAIAKGQNAVSAWQTRETVRERVVAVANSLHWVRRRADRGFIADATGRVDAWPPGNDERHTSAKTWESLDGILDQLGVSPAAVAIMLGGDR